MQCNWCKKDEREDFTDPKKLQEHKYQVHDAERRPEFRRLNRADVTDEQIFTLIRKGLSIRQSADQLKIGHNTVAYRLARVKVREIRATLASGTNPIPNP